MTGLDGRENAPSVPVTTLVPAALMLARPVVVVLLVAEIALVAPIAPAAASVPVAGVEADAVAAVGVERLAPSNARVIVKGFNMAFRIAERGPGSRRTTVWFWEAGKSDQGLTDRGRTWVLSRRSAAVIWADQPPLIGVLLMLAAVVGPAASRALCSPC
ncbi:hypothetical protein ABZ897_40460 [Nonomuraea sp. NPDC046802]|uniref:hypothetical protein n=1 Tax=Nonomuraea sp. NPDC046802 TaxID=3154919 RepID=UPI0033D48B3C